MLIDCRFISGKLISGFRRSSQVEIDPFARSVIAARQKEGHLPSVPVFEDITTFVPTKCGGDIAEAKGMVGGFPCQACSFCHCAVIDFVGLIHFRGLLSYPLSLSGGVQSRQSIGSFRPSFVASGPHISLHGQPGGYTAFWN